MLNCHIEGLKMLRFTHFHRVKDFPNIMFVVRQAFGRIYTCCSFSNIVIVNGWGESDTTIKSFPTIKKKNTFRKSSTVLASMNVCSIAFLSTYLPSFQIILVNIPALIIHRIISGQDRMSRQMV